MTGAPNAVVPTARPRARRLRRTLICCLVALTGLAPLAPAAAGASVVYANTNLGAGGWWRNPNGATLTTILNFNRISIDQSWTVRAILCWNYAQTTYRGVTLPCGWPGPWYTQVFTGNKFLQINDTFGGNYGMQAICENPNPNTANGYCAWYY